MNSLPEQFINDDENAVDPIHADSDQHEYLTNSDKTKKSKNKKTFFSVALIVALFSVVLNGVVFWVVVDKPVDKLASIFGGAAVSTLSVADAQQTVLIQLQKNIADYSATLSAMAESIKSLNEQLSDLKNELSNVTEHETQLENRYQLLSTEIEQLKKAKAVSKPIVPATPKESVKPPVLMSLLSIRTQGGELWVSLREGQDSSPLLALGDEWKDCKVLSVDALKKEVQLRINGVATVVTL
jgi:regulator of replication initiation timing